MIVAIIHQFNGGGGLFFSVLTILDDVVAASETVANAELVPIGRNMRGDGQGVALLVQAEDVLDARLVGP